MNFCRKCGSELQVGKCSKCDGKKNKIIIGGVIITIVIALGGYFAYNSYINKKVKEYKEKAMIELKEEKYKDADKNLEECKKLKKNNEEVNNVLEVLDKYFEIESFYKEKDYPKTKELIVKIKENSQYDKVKAGTEKIEESIKNIEKLDEEIKELESKIKGLINKNNYTEVNKTLEKYRDYELREDQKALIDKLNKDVESKEKKYKEAEKAKKEANKKKVLVSGFWKSQTYVLKMVPTGQRAILCGTIESGVYFSDLVKGISYEEKSGIVTVNMDSGEDETGHDLARYNVRFKFISDNEANISTDSGPWQRVTRISETEGVNTLKSNNVPGYID